MSEEIGGLLWPDVPRMSFGRCEPSFLNACVGWVRSLGNESHSVYADGYREAARRLYESICEGHGTLDCLIFPIAFLWRHHIELRLKEIIGRANLLEGDAFSFPEHHKLQGLWALAKPQIEGVSPPASKDVANAEHDLRELDRIDPGSFSFRYPNAKGNAGPNLSDLDYLNLRMLHEAMEATSNLLEGVVGVQGQRQEAVWEAMAHQGER